MEGQSFPMHEPPQVRYWIMVALLWLAVAYILTGIWEFRFETYLAFLLPVALVLGWRMQPENEHMDIYVTKQGIAVRRYKENVKFVAWEDIADAHETDDFREIHLMNDAGETILKLSRFVDKFNTLHTLILERMKRPSKQKVVFHRQPLSKDTLKWTMSLLAGIIFVPIILNLIRGEALATILANQAYPVGVALIIVVLTHYRNLTAARRMTIDREKVLIESPLQTKSIKIADIKGAYLESSARAPAVTRYKHVILDTAQGKEIKLNEFLFRSEHIKEFLDERLL